MPATVVIPTYRRPEGLRRLVDAVRAQHDGEIVVVDNATPPTVGPTSGVRIVHEATPGASAARNRGIAEASGDVIVFLDDDVVPQPGFIEAIARSDADGVGGRVVLADTPLPRWLRPAGSVAGYLTAFDLGERRELRRGEFVITAAAAFRTDLLRDVGGFDTTVGPTGEAHLVNDDVLLCRRLQERGARLAFEPGAVVVHEVPAERATPRWLLRRAYLQGRSDWLTDDGIREGRFGGASQAAKWLAHELRQRARDDRDIATAFHALTDVARTVGALRQATVLAARNRRAL